MHRIYKSGRIEISGESFAIKADMPPPPVMVQQDIPVPDAEHEGVLAPTEASDSITIAEAQLIIDKANLQAAQIIAAARQRGNDEFNKVRMQAQQEAAEVRNNAFLEGQSQGFAEGAAAKVNAIEQTIARLEQVVAGIEGGIEGFISEYESDLRWAVCEVSSKVLHRIVERDELELVEMVKAAVDQVKNAEWIDLHLARESQELIDRLQRELAPLRQLEVVPDDLPPGSCLLDIPSGKLDASIDTQLQNLQDYFRSHISDL